MQTDITMDALEEMEAALKERQNYRWGVKNIADNDLFTKFYTGLPSFAVFMWLFKYVF